MITFHTIKWKNFLSAGNNFTEIPLDDAKNTLIMGHNGSGKSTFLDALCFVLFGKPFRKITKGNIVNSINQKNCVVEVEFTVNSKRYKIIRGIKPAVFEIHVGSKSKMVMLNQDAAAKDYQEHLEKNILKMNFKSFTQIVILGSASFTPFMQLSAADRRAVIEDLLDIQIFSSMSTIVKNKLQINKEAIEINRVKAISKGENKSYIESTLKSLKTNSDQKLAALITKRDDLDKKKEIETTRVAELETKYQSMLEGDVDLKPLRVKHGKLLAYKANMEANKDHHINDNKFFDESDKCPTCRQSIEESFKETMIKRNQKKIADIDDGLNKIDVQIDSCLNEIEKIEQVLKAINEIRMDLASSKSSLNAVSVSIADVVEQINGLATSDKTTQDTERQLETVEHDISTLQKEKEALLDERQYIDLATTLLKDGGIKTKIIKQYLPIINKHINKYLAKLGFFVNFNINESFEESIKSRYRDEFSYHNFSEGEKLRIDLAILLTWRQIAKMKNSVNVNILVFDEILDRAMDAAGTDEFIKIMWDELSNKGTNVFVISHKDVMVDKFQRVFKFEKVKNFSTMTKEG